MKPPISTKQKGWLVGLDVLFLVASFSVVMFAQFHRADESIILRPLILAIAALAVTCLYIVGAYDLDDNGGRWFLWRWVALALFANFAIVLTFDYLFQSDRAGFFGGGVLIGGLALDLLIA